VSFRLELRAQVDLDIASAAASYESRQPGLGTDFVRAIRDCIEEILRDPLLPRIRDRARQIRWVLPPRFPYRIVFRVVQETVIVYAIMHAVRHDRHWKRRV
jgi:plasmid stabilization system protein ParE